jgi:ABC-type multidrug transport system ATPase subunit
MTESLVLNRVEHSFGKKQVLSNVNFTCNTGDVLAIFGRNGSGKSTLLKILFGTLKADKIELYLNNNKVSKITPKRRLIACLPQDPFLPKDLKVRDIIPLYFPDGEIQNKIFYAPFINKLENQKIGTLSLGEQKYLEFLLIINLSHPFILLDEPFSMVEPLYKEAIKETIPKHKNTKGFVITDHYYNDVIDTANKRIIISQGISSYVSDMNDLIEYGYLSPAKAK